MHGAEKESGRTRESSLFLLGPASGITGAFVDIASAGLPRVGLALTPRNDDPQGADFPAILTGRTQVPPSPAQVAGILDTSYEQKGTW